MYPETGTTVIRKRLSFFSVLILSLAAIVITVIVSASGIAVYGLRIADRKADGLIGLVQQTARMLPDFREALPPVLADALDDERRPDYLDRIKVTVKLVAATDRVGDRAVVQVTNQGNETVSLLSMRIVGLDDEGNPVFERNTWAATPLQIERDWRGPLLPHATRRFPINCTRTAAIASLSHEVTDIRIWRGISTDVDGSNPKLKDASTDATHF